MKHYKFTFSKPSSIHIETYPVSVRVCLERHIDTLQTVRSMAT